jgi:type VI secretion system secreted protein VgrG
MATSKPLQMALTTSPDVKLRFMSMSGQEEISRLFEYQVQAVSENGDIAADDLLGKPAAVSLDQGGGRTRWFHGIVAACGIDGGDGRFVSYRLTLRPWLWLLTRSADIRIFPDQSVPDIIQAVFAEYQGQVRLALNGSFAPRPYCVQYRETDFNFVCRLMEEEGIFFWFDHSADKHELVLANHAGAHEPQTGFDKVLFRTDAKAQGALPTIHQWHMRHEIQSGAMVLSDYNFEKPSTSLRTDAATQTRNHEHKDLEVYDYPGLYAEKSDGTDLAKLRLEEVASRFGRFTGQGDTTGLAAGGCFALAQHPRKDQNTDYIVLGTQIDMRLGGYESGTGDASFLCRFSLQQLAEPFRPQRNTPKPSVAGPQTAVVVGKGAAGDIVPDKYGRVQVQFHWDRLGKNDGAKTCWVRVSSPWAGNGFGMINLPRLGQEVVVDFLEGDPDQPLITGRVHNAEQMPPYELPANASVSTLKSRSVKGPVDAFNELRFEDKKGDEYIWLQAQKDRFEVVEETLKSEIRHHEHRTVKKDRKEKIEGEHHLTVTKGVKQKFGDKFSADTTGDILLKGGAGYSLKIAQGISAEAGQGISLKAGTDLHIKIGTNSGLDSGMNVHIKGGMNVVIEGGMQVSIKAGPSSVVLGPDGVSITGPMVKINSGGAAGSGSGASPVAPTAPEAPQEPELPKDPLEGKHR